MKVEGIAKIAHEINKAYCESIGDFSQGLWVDAPEWQKKSAVNGVEYHLSNPDTTPLESHNSWLREKISNGWVYAKIKNASRKEHPCIVSYESLPIDQRAKDFIFKQVVDSLKEFIDEK